MKEIKQVNDKLTNESKNIDNNLKLLAHSTKQSAELLLIKKRLHRLLFEFQIQQLSKTPLPHNKVRTMEHTMNKIDGIRKFVGDLDIKVFHAKDIKNKWNKQETTIQVHTIENLSLIDDSDDHDDVLISENSDSDNKSFEDDWTYIGTTNPLYPHTRHHCRNIGCCRYKRTNYQKTKLHHMNIRRKHKEMANIKQKRDKSSHSIPVHDTPFIPRSGLLHNKIEQLLKILNSQLQDQNKRKKREQS